LRAAEIHLTRDELLVLRLAREYDWRKVELHIFGSLLQGKLGAEAQHALEAPLRLAGTTATVWRRRERFYLPGLPHNGRDIAGGTASMSSATPRCRVTSRCGRRGHVHYDR